MLCHLGEGVKGGSMILIGLGLEPGILYRVDHYWQNSVAQYVLPVD